MLKIRHLKITACDALRHYNGTGSVGARSARPRQWPDQLRCYGNEPMLRSSRTREGQGLESHSPSSVTGGAV
ncbi:hypothetical protein LX82_00531 [Celeribacter halophilus]|uniref:Uncharacterized protein n=1 Tax=Celeribacter halophilus TaxID=576117 RepID=A0A1I3P3R9_9RHOB|nr:hypothetical protein LX82_00531 [Celeribacter halophilus]SFJ15987.1 hypothetical protein SAMN04488138_102180 [Celeribacter halophilus]